MADGSVIIDTELDSSGLKTGLANLGKIAAAGITSAVAAVGTLTKAAVESYAEYEQLIGGVETLYGQKYKSAEEYAKATGASLEMAASVFEQYSEREKAVLDNAANAYKTAGMSANEYMNTVNGFAASLTSSLGEYEWQAASYAEMIVTDMADNANKMGTSMEAIQNAYSGFAKQNYTMLDNLKLGYGGTKEEMERLMRDAEKYAGYIEGSLDVSNFADVADAIHIIQEEMGITGTTATEAGETIQGSISMAKAAYDNFLTGLADENADLGVLATNLVESATTALNNLLPAISQTVLAIPDSILPILSDTLPQLISDLLPQLVESGVSLISSLLEGIRHSSSDLIDAALEIGLTLVSGISEVGVSLLQTGHWLLTSLMDGISDAIPDIIYAIVNVLPVIIASIISTLVGLIPLLIECGIDLFVALVAALPQIIYTIVAVLPQIINSIITALLDSIPLIIQCGIDLLVSLIGALPDIIVALVTAMPTIISSIITALLDNIPLLIQSGIDLFLSLITAMPKIIKELVEAIPQVITALVDALGDGLGDFKETGKNLLEGIWEGIKNAKQWLVDKVKSLGSTITEALKDALGIHSPSRVFRDEIGKYLPLGLADGISAEAAAAITQVEDLAHDLADIDFTLSDPDFPVDDIDYDGLIGNAKMSVYADSTDVGKSISANIVSKQYSDTSTDGSVNNIPTEKNEPKYIQNDIYVDGKKAGRVLTPYVAKELDWEGK